ncbi:MAG: UV-endonuclease [Planctomycetota bacterium]|jgi:endonuclease-3
MSSKIPKESPPGSPEIRHAKRGGRESLANRRARAADIVRELARLFPTADCALHHQSAFQLLTATILSAQCTDERVNKATPELFRLFPDAHALAVAGQTEVEAIVKPLGFFRAKATNIRGMAQALVERYGGEVPASLEALVQLPGVGRKTASVVLGTWFGIPSGVVVDTHVTRITNLLGLVKSSNPEIIERELMQLLPQEEWIMFSHRTIYHGRKTCVARRPNCLNCGLLPLCKRAGLPPLE